MKKLCLLLTLIFMTCTIASAKDNYGYIDAVYIMNKYTVAVNISNNVKQKESEIQRLLADANKKIANTKDENAKKQIEATAKKQIQPKLDALQSYKKQQYAKIETNINKAIEKVAKTNNYALILNGNSVAFGATDVSDLILKELNQNYRY